MKLDLITAISSQHISSRVNWLLKPWQILPLPTNEDQTPRTHTMGLNKQTLCSYTDSWLVLLASGVFMLN